MPISTSQTPRVAIVTGGSGGIGQAVSRRMGSEGMSVVVHYADNSGRANEVVDNIGGDTLRRSWGLLAPGGTLVSYAIASVVKGTGSMVIPFLALLIRLAWWNALPNGHRATFYDVWAGHRRHPEAFRARVRQDLTTVLNLLADLVLTAHVAARLPLAQAREALELAESRTVYGKVTLLP